MDLTGGPNEPPTKSGLSLVDFSAGYVAAIALMGGIWKARRDGVGGDVDLSLFETALALLTYLATWNASLGWQPRRLAESAHQLIVPFQAFEAADGWLVVACAKESLWRKFCAAIGRPELAADERFHDFAARDRNRDPLLEELRRIFATRTVSDWDQLLRGHGVPSCPVNDVAGALADAQVEARGSVVAYDHPLLGEVRGVASALGPTLTAEPARAPMLGEHTNEILTELCGYDSQRIQALMSLAAFGAPES
jgi:crotonobetainyl-CoA:carnitine CoA-transferase CaiB-like acyl-CoA transferase